jgi:hypothetical protein
VLNPATTEAGTGAATEKARIFLSYSRRNERFADHLAAALGADGFRVLQDKADILPGEDWQKRLAGMIEAAHAVVYLATPDSLNSTVCNWEIETATGLNRKIVPVAIGAIDYAALPPAVAELNVLRSQTYPTFEALLAAVEATVTTDIGWVREHTRLSELALAWQRGDGSADLMLRGAALRAAEDWRASAPPGAQGPTPLHDAFFAASRLAAKKRARQLTIAGAVAAGLALAAGLFGLRSMILSGDVATKSAEIRNLSSTTTKFAENRRLVKELFSTRAANIEFIRGKIPEADVASWLDANTKDEHLPQLQDLSSFIAYTRLAGGSDGTPRFPWVSRYVMSSDALKVIKWMETVAADPSQRRNVIKTMITSLNIPQAQKDVYLNALPMLAEEGEKELYENIVRFTNNIQVKSFLSRVGEATEALALVEEDAGRRNIATVPFLLALSETEDAGRHWPGLADPPEKLLQVSFMLHRNKLIDDRTQTAVLASQGYTAESCTRQDWPLHRRVLFYARMGKPLPAACKALPDTVDNCALKLAFDKSETDCIAQHRSGLYQALLPYLSALDDLSASSPFIIAHEQPVMARLALGAERAGQETDDRMIAGLLNLLVAKFSPVLVLQPPPQASIDLMRGKAFGGFSYTLLLKGHGKEALEAAEIALPLAPQEPFVLGNVVLARAFAGGFEAAKTLYLASQGLHIKFETFSDQTLLDLKELAEKGVTGGRLKELEAFIRAHLATGDPKLAKSLKSKEKKPDAAPPAQP